MLLVVVGAGCGQAPSSEGPLAQFSGEYRIIEAGNEASPGIVEELAPGLPVVGLMTRLRQSWASSLGNVRVQPAVGGEYAEWNMAFDDPAHEIRRMVGPRQADGSFPIWRFEQQPAPALDHHGVLRLERNAVVAEFVSRASAPRPLVIRERWTLVGDDTLEFALEAGPSSEKLIRVGRFTAVRE
jgi:hypothetical protein